MRKVLVIALVFLAAPSAPVAPLASAFAQATVARQQVGTLRLYIARHGETDWNAQHKLQGMTDIPLNENGRKQAAALAESLTGVHLDAIYSSTLSRSRDTAQTVAGK